MNSKQFRIERFFHNTEHSLIVAIDHGMMIGAAEGIHDLRTILGKLVNAPVNGLLLSPVGIKMMRELYPKCTLPVTCSIDYAHFQSVTDHAEKSFAEHRVLWKIEEAVKYGADAVKVFLNFGDDNELLMQNMEALRHIFRESERFNIPVMVEVLFLNNAKFDNPFMQPQLLSDACRLAYELGADILKVPIIEQTDVYSEIINNIPVPLLVLGGSKMKEEELNAKVRDLVNQGIHGVVFGRNVWKSPVMDKVISDLGQIMHALHA